MLLLLRPPHCYAYHSYCCHSYSSYELTHLVSLRYLTDSGAPTVVFNQTTPTGNGDDPKVAKGGFVVHPSAGRHVVFRGDLNHGVPGSVS